MTDALIVDAMRRLLERALIKARPRVRESSKTLAEALTIQVQGLEGALFIPHYWAVYLERGRGPVTSQSRRWLVWFPNIGDDPRVDGGASYPVRAADIRRLTRDEFQFGLEMNRQRRASGDEPYMIVSKISGPARARPFFSDLDMRPEAGEEFTRALDQLVLQGVPRQETVELKVRL